MNHTPVLSYRKTIKEDWPLILTEEKKLAKNPYYYAFTDDVSFAKYMQHSFVFTLLVDNTFAGYCSYKMIDNKTAELNGMVVVPAVQGIGLSKYAIKILFEKMKHDTKIKTIILTVHPKNSKAQVIYCLLDAQ